MDDELQIRKIYEQLVSFWNIRYSDKMAALFAEDGNIVAFDGNQINGRNNIEQHLADVFAHYKTLPYICIIREVRRLSGNVMLLRAVAGMMPEADADVNPALNVVHSVVVVKQNDKWEIVLFQNTPTSPYGKAEAVNVLTDELNFVAKELKKKK